MQENSSQEAALPARETLRLLDFAVVLVGRNHNPSLINPDFLRIHGIVPDGLTPQQVIVVEPFALVEYKEGLSVQVEQARMQVRVRLQGTMPRDPLPIGIALKYVEVLPRIPYEAAGINWSVAIPMREALTWLTENLIEPRARQVAGGRVTRARVELAIDVGDTFVNLTWSGGKGKAHDELRLSANFHHPKPESAGGASWIGQALERWPEHQLWLEQYCQRALGGST